MTEEYKEDNVDLMLRLENEEGQRFTAYCSFWLKLWISAKKIGKQYELNTLICSLITHCKELFPD
uniref:Uncharacterized protein n=1 Tax=viral metagenome TaxID=1070528 RepID=A0A6M3LEA5_9ZZZZ